MRINSQDNQSYELTIAAVDSAGHIGVSLQLKRPTHLFGKTIFHQVQIAFEADAGRLGQLVEDFEQMIREKS